jgi:pimeloyl-ACP methyl ester carboxylesterase
MGPGRDTLGHMDRAALDGVELEYEIRGAGEPVVLVHHGAGADWFGPLLEEPALTRRYRLLRYHRAGYAGSSPLVAPLTFAREAAVFRALMLHLELDRVHVVGHSASGCIALQIALDVPDIVQSVALLEPALLAVPSPAEVPRALALYRAGDTITAVDTFLRATCGLQYRAILEKAVPGAVDQALADADTFFSHELPALRQWSFGPTEAGRVRQPVLAVVGDESDARFQQRQKLLLEWLPNVEPLVLAGAGHLLHLQNPSDLADGLAAFFARHRLAER